MSGPKRNPDKLNTIGVVVVGICGAVLVYVTIVALQAFYVNDTSELQTMMDYGGQDQTAKGHKADEMRNITEAGRNAPGPGQEATYRIPIDKAMQLVVEQAKQDPSHLIPALPPSTKASIEPVFGRPKLAAPPAGGAAPGPEGAGSAAPAGGGAAPAGAGSAAPAGAAGSAATQVPTGAPGGPQPVAGAAGMPSGTTTAPTPTNPVLPGGTQPKTDAKTQPKAPKTDAKTQPKAPAQPKADAKAPVQPKADATKGSAQPKTP